MITELGGVRVFVSDGPVDDDGDAVQLIAQAHYEHAAEWVALTTGALGDEFFELRSGRAGAIVQKFVHYRMGLAVVGDISDRLAASKPLRAWVRESNQGRSVWFVDELSALAERFSA
ncbi:DUF4180 domain-containing protein [Kribbella turkmenica]|uniref:DUF4180 domain-containing protein n=1 Tax=Kribbella turkmenica TaxID=2530375 RepID=A0A4R4WKE7_9ACTN|nr:DUF4180 domain-containing protein [Kribbella turkmenica]TDD19579.1 DUF4180 domain-containing protein [Kribbella turkmenica]